MWSKLNIGKRGQFISTREYILFSSRDVFKVAVSLKRSMFLCTMLQRSICVVLITYTSSKVVLTSTNTTLQPTMETRERKNLP